MNRILRLFCSLTLAAGLALAAPVVTDASAAWATADATPGALVTVPPTRLLDTRSGIGASAAPVSGGHAVALQVAGRGGVPSGATAVVMNVTVTQPTAPGVVTVYADGGPRPGTSNLNFVTGQTVPNLVVAPMAPNGKVDLFVTSSGSVQVIADVSGYFVSGTPSAPGTMATLNPSRLLDTRTGVGAPAGPVLGGHSVVLQVAGRGGVPSGASAVLVNVTATSPTAAGAVTVYADGRARPGTSNLNTAAGRTSANLVLAPVGADGKIDLYLSSSGSVALIADVFGYLLGGAAVVPGALAPIQPSRALDTRVGVGAPAGPVSGGHAVALQVAGRGGVPWGATAVVMNVTVTQPTAPGVVTVYADGSPRPSTSNLNFVTGQTVPNLVLVPLSAGGKVDLSVSSAGSAHLIADVSGYVLGPPKTWSRQMSTYPAEGMQFYTPGDVQCFAAGECAVSAYISPMYGSQGWTTPVFSRLSGGTWSTTQLVGPRNYAITSGPRLSCADSSDCVEVASAASGNQTVLLVDTLAAGAWMSTTITPPGTGFQLGGVSCPAVGSCVLVGAYADTDGTETIVSYVLANGVWTPSTTKTTYQASAGGIAPSKVTCVSTISCVAVGRASESTAVSDGLLATLSGTSWVITSVPPRDLTKPGPAAWFTTLSCASGDPCTAFGGDDVSPLTATLVNGDWTTAPMAAPPSNQANLGELACGSSEDCVTLDVPGGNEALGWQWSGGTWTSAPAHGMFVTAIPSVTASTCVNTSWCIAIGYENPGQSSVYGVAETYDHGTWTPSYIPSGAADASLQDVSCPSTTTCFSVGQATHYTRTTTAFLDIVGQHTQTFSDLPSVLQIGATTQAVSCPTTTFCAVAEGPAVTSGSIQANVGLYQNGSWTTADLPFEPNDISCSAVGSCVAVGSTGQVASLTNGSWVATTVPDPSGDIGGSDDLTGVSCAAVGECTAVGRYDTSAGPMMLEEVLHSGTWTWRPVPQSAAIDNFGRLSDVSCTSPTVCTAVGYTYENVGAQAPHPQDDFVIEQNGNVSSVTVLPNSWGDNAGHNPGYAAPTIACPAAGACLTVDTFYGQVLQNPIVWVQSPQGWAIDGPAASPTDFSALQMGAISCPTTAVCVGVGSIGFGAGIEPEVYTRN